MFAKRNESAGGRSVFFSLSLVAERSELPQPVLPRCLRPAGPRSASVLGPFPWTSGRLSLRRPPEIPRFSQQTFRTFLSSVPGAPECPPGKVPCSHPIPSARCAAFGEASSSAPKGLRSVSCPPDGDAHLHAASLKPAEGLSLLARCLQPRRSSPRPPATAAFCCRLLSYPVPHRNASRFK